MVGSYEFLVDLRRLMAVYRRLEQVQYLLNAIIIGVVVYAASLPLGIPAFFRFYWQDFLPLAEAPAILSLLLGVGGAHLMKRRGKSDLFEQLGGELSEKARSAYDNRDSDSIVMQSLAKDVKRALSALGASNLIQSRRVVLGEKSAPMLYIKVGAAALLLGGVLIFSQTQAGEEISPADIQSLVEIKNRATGLFQEEEFPEEGTSRTEISGEIYGKPSLAVLEEVNLELLLFPGSGAGFRSRETVSEDRIFQATPPGEGVAVPTELYIESLPPQHREIIKRYFENLAKG